MGDHSLQSTAVNCFIGVVRAAYRKGWTRGWFPASAAVGACLPEARTFHLSVSGLGPLVVDLRESMCFGAISRGAVFGAEANLLKRLLRPGDVVYDIGANYGWTTVHSAQSVGATGQVVAFEPSSVALRLLHMNTAARSNVKVFRLALGSEEGTAIFYNAEHADMSSFTAPSLGLPIRSTETVPVIRLDKLVSDRGLRFPNVIKCDVEGAEMGVFLGAKNVLSRSPMVFFEYSETLARPHGYDLDALIKLVLDSMQGNAKVYRVADDGSVYGSLAVREGISNNYLVVPDEYFARLHD